MDDASPGSDLLASVFERLDADRLLGDTFRFVAIPSPTGEEAAFAEEFAPFLESVGLDEVEIDREFASSPSVIARWRAAEGRPILHLDGHSDAIVIPHAPPQLDETSGTVRGRGAADMKGGLVALAHALRAIREAGVVLAGGVLFTVHGLHEAPGGDQRTLRSLLKRGIAGDAALIAELSHDSVPITARGMSIFRFQIARPGGVMHEVELGRRQDNPIIALQRLLSGLDELARELHGRRHDLLGSESLFLGEVHGGDFYNRVPETVEVVGTRRYLAPSTNDDVTKELQALAEEVAAETGLSIAVALQQVAAPYRFDHSEPIVAALQRGFEQATGRHLPVSGASAVGNAADFAQAGIPAVYHGVNQASAHSDNEFVTKDDLLRAARVYAAAILNFCGVQQTSARRG